VRELATANGLTAESTIYPGMELSVPAGNAAATAPPRTRTHIVRRGETLTGIAARYEVSVQNLMAWNNLASANALRPGQTLVLSADVPSIAPQTVYTTRRGDTLAGVARRFHVSARDLAAANGLSTRTKLRPGQKLKIPGAVASRPDATDKWITYKVRSGDTLARIAQRHGCSVDDLAQWNNLRRNATLRAGQVIKIKVKKRT
jgi:LysM repeat protein